MSCTRERSRAGAGSSEPSPRAAVARLQGPRAIVSRAAGRVGDALLLEDEDRGWNARRGQAGEERRAVGHRARWDHEDDLGLRRRREGCGRVHRARDENLTAGPLERDPHGLRDAASRAEQEKGPHRSSRGTVRAVAGRVKATARISTVRIDPALVSRVASLAGLELTDAERGALSGQLTRIVEHFETLRALPDELLGADVPAPPSPLRPDEARDGSPGALVEANAPEFAHGHFVVPRVVSRDA